MSTTINEDSKFSMRNSVNELERMRQESQMASQVAKEKQVNYAAVAAFNSSGAREDEAKGNTMMMTGTVKVAGGFAQMFLGGAMLAKGLAMNALPGAGTPFMIEGMSLIAKGTLDVGAGKVDQEQAKQALARAQERLDIATQNNILGRQEAVMVIKEENRARIMEFKKELTEQMAEVIKPMLERAGINAQELTDEDIEKQMDKLFESGAKCLASGGIMEIDLEGQDKEASFKDSNGDELKGNFYFTRDEENGDYYKVDLAYDGDGNPLKGTLGENLLDTSKGVSKVEDGDLKKYLDLKFLIVDKLELLSKELCYTNFDSNDNIQLTPYNSKDLKHMTEFADLVMKTDFEDIKSGKLIAPRKAGVDDNGKFFQAWDWINNVPLGPKTYESEIYGETEDMRGSIDNYQLALNRSSTALQALGMEPGGAVFNVLNATGNTNLKSKDVGNQVRNSPGMDSIEFLDFKSALSTMTMVGSQRDILSSSSSDDLPDGLA
jgi:hypothetical protein